MEMPVMPQWIRIWMVTLLFAAAVPLSAQEWIYCPAAPEELERQCRQAETTIHDYQKRMAVVGEQMQNPDIILAKVDRKPDETVIRYKRRVMQQQGVATPANNRWIPLQGRYYDPNQQVMYVAIDRQSYWQYVWETLAPDENFARRTFLARERISQQFKQARFTGPGGMLVQWRQTIEAAGRFRQQCCQPLPNTDASASSGMPKKQSRP
jgi:hypothetical protein